MYLYIISVQHLTQSLAPHLNSCVMSGIFSSAAKEKSWTKFHQRHDQLRSSLRPAIQNPQLSSFILLRIMDKLLQGNCSSPASPAKAKPESTISDEELDIVAYIGGFVLYRTRKVFQGNDACLSVINRTTKKKGEKLFSKLIEAKTRGGLCEPKDDIISFFQMCEKLFRDSFTSIKSFSCQLFVDSVCSRKDITSLFYECCYHCDTEVHDQETVLLFILGVFFE